jgi:hypothetical protein
MTSYIRGDLRRTVLERAGGRCEYCGIRERDTYLGCQIDHIISEKHGGLTESENLALACCFCNRFKGADIASLDEQGQELIRFFNPRTDNWNDHFQINGARIEPKTKIGEVTVRMLKFNFADRQMERQALMTAGRYPL